MQVQVAERFRSSFLFLQSNYLVFWLPVSIRAVVISGYFRITLTHDWTALHLPCTHAFMYLTLLYLLMYLPSCFWHYIVQWNHVPTLFLFRQLKSERQVLCHVKPHLDCVSLEEHAKQLELSTSYYNTKLLFSVS